MWQLAGKPPITELARRVELPSIEPTADGWIGVNTNTRQQFESFLVMIERTDLLEHDEAWAYADTRWNRMEEWNTIVHAWTRKHTTAEIVELASTSSDPGRAREQRAHGARPSAFRGPRRVDGVTR